MTEFADRIMPQIPMIRGGSRMNVEIVVGVTKLVKVLEENRAKHLKDFEETTKIFEQKYKEKLDEMVKDGKFEMAVKLTKPKCHVESYDSMINVLNMSVEPTIKMAAYELQSYLADKWDWKDSFENTKSLYFSR
jgi:hypothetical protein